jgi:hypothetical protein
MSIKIKLLMQRSVFLVAQPIGTPLDDPDLVVQTLDEPEGDLVLGFTVGGNTIPMSINHSGKCLVRLQPLPLEARAPVPENRRAQPSRW